MSIVVNEELKKEVFEICKLILGEAADGIYAVEDEIDNDIAVFYSNLEDEFMIEETSHIRVQSGASKIVLVPDYLDYVIKIDISHLITENLTVVAEVSERTLVQEKEIYSWSDELKKVLMPVIFISEYNNIPIFIQEKFTQTFGDFLDEKEFEIDDYEEEENGYKNIPILNSILNHYDYYNRKQNFSYISKQLSTQIERLTEIYPFGRKGNYIYSLWIKRFGYDTTKKIVEEIISSALNDLHWSNIAFDSTGVIKLCDYGGYHSSLHWDYL